MSQIFRGSREFHGFRLKFGHPQDSHKSQMGGNLPLGYDAILLSINSISNLPGVSIKTAGSILMDFPSAIFYQPHETYGQTLCDKSMSMKILRSSTSPRSSRIAAVLDLSASEAYSTDMCLKPCLRWAQVSLDPLAHTDTGAVSAARLLVTFKKHVIFTTL